MTPTGMGGLKCWGCGEPILHAADLVRAHALDTNGFGRMNAPFHVDCAPEQDFAGMDEDDDDGD